eukprot:1387248-Prymnesium_polylepis.2
MPVPSYAMALCRIAQSEALCTCVCWGYRPRGVASWHASKGCLCAVSWERPTYCSPSSLAEGGGYGPCVGVYVCVGVCAIRADRRST